MHAAPKSPWKVTRISQMSEHLWDLFMWELSSSPANKVDETCLSKHSFIGSSQFSLFLWFQSFVWLGDTIVGKSLSEKGKSRLGNHSSTRKRKDKEKVSIPSPGVEMLSGLKMKNQIKANNQPAKETIPQQREIPRAAESGCSIVTWEVGLSFTLREQNKNR